MYYASIIYTAVITTERFFKPLNIITHFLSQQQYQFLFMPFTYARKEIKKGQREKNSSREGKKSNLHFYTHAMKILLPISWKKKKLFYSIVQ